MTDFLHAYTNAIRRDGDTVVKQFVGPQAHERCRTEALALRKLLDRLPVPELLSSSENDIRTRFVSGVHGKDLLDRGHASEVMQVCGRTLRTLQGIPVTEVFDRSSGDVVVHGDFGPNNLILNGDTLELTAVVDWEWCHTGDPVEDAAWCEWIVRTFHPEQVGHLDDFFRSYGSVPTWSDRQAAMVAKLHHLLVFATDHLGDSETTETRKRQLAATEEWSE